MDQGFLVANPGIGQGAPEKFPRFSISIRKQNKPIGVYGQP